MSFQSPPAAAAAPPASRAWLSREGCLLLIVAAHGGCILPSVFILDARAAEKLAVATYRQPEASPAAVGPERFCLFVDGLFQMTAKLEAHRREQLVLVVRLAAREKALRRARCSAPAWAPSSMAALIVQRPSPGVGTTRPENFFARSAESSASAVAVRSSSQEAITLLRRQTSATSGRLMSYW